MHSSSVMLDARAVIIDDIKAPTVLLSVMKSLCSDSLISSDPAPTVSLRPPFTPAAAAASRTTGGRTRRDVSPTKRTARCKTRGVPLCNTRIHQSRFYNRRSEDADRMRERLSHLTLIGWRGTDADQSEQTSASPSNR